MTLSDALTWVLDNKGWLFSGIGVAAITAVVALFKRRQNGTTQTQHSGANSTNVQAGRDININGGTSKSDDGR
jgi:hypothetical protein